MPAQSVSSALPSLRLLLTPLSVLIDFRTSCREEFTAIFIDQSDGSQISVYCAQEVSLVRPDALSHLTFGSCDAVTLSEGSSYTTSGFRLLDQAPLPDQFDIGRFSPRHPSQYNVVIGGDACAASDSDGWSRLYVEEQFIKRTYL